MGRVRQVVPFLLQQCDVGVVSLMLSVVLNVPCLLLPLLPPSAGVYMHLEVSMRYNMLLCHGVCSGFEGFENSEYFFFRFRAETFAVVEATLCHEVVE